MGFVLPSRPQLGLIALLSRRPLSRHLRSLHMSKALRTVSQPEVEPRTLARRACAVITALAATWSLAACGGGGSDAPDAVAFDIGVAVAGKPLNGVLIEPGVARSLTIAAGQSIELDASEPVIW